MLASSPPQDIGSFSKLERLMDHISGSGAKKTKELIATLGGQGKYEITDDMKAQLSDFYGNFAGEEETALTIAKIYRDCGYVLDTHTAVAAAVYGKYKAETKDETKTVIASTASPFKFTRSVMNAIDPKYDAMDDFALADALSQIANVEVPKAIQEIRTAPVVHDKQCDVDQMQNVVREFLKL